MKNLHTIIFISLFTTALFSIVAYTSCKKTEQQEIQSCQNGGTLINGACKCAEGFEGKRCETKVDYCEQTGCQNGGTCVGFCRCTGNYTGKYCEIDLCKDVVCNNGGTCKGGDCACASGYNGPKCDTLIKQRYIGRWKAVSSCETTVPGAILVIDDIGASNAAQLNVSYAITWGAFATRAFAHYDGKVRPEFSSMYVPGGYWLGFIIESNGTELLLSYEATEIGYGDKDQCLISFTRE